MGDRWVRVGPSLCDGKTTSKRGKQVTVKQLA